MGDKSLRKINHFQLPIDISDRLEVMSARLGISASTVVEQMLRLCCDDYIQSDLLEHVRLLSTDINFAIGGTDDLVIGTNGFTASLGHTTSPGE